MTQLYRAVPVTTAEQAEALPDGTHVVTFHDPVLESPLILVKLDGEFYDWSSNGFLLPAEIVGIRDSTKALIPVELGEERRTNVPGRRGIRPVRRLVTAWEDIPNDHPNPAA